MRSALITRLISRFFFRRLFRRNRSVCSRFGRASTCPSSCCKGRFHPAFRSGSNPIRSNTFCGRSGIGKSTQANLWKEYENALILNGDRCAVGFVDGAANAFGLPFCGTSGICLNFSLPIAAIISLGQAPENRITRLSGVRALRAIMSNIVGLYGGAMRESHAELFSARQSAFPF